MGTLTEISTLRQEIARLSLVIEELEERLPDPDEGAQLRPEVNRKLLKARETPRTSLLSIEEVRQKLKNWKGR